jgi:hypothetical protein
VLETLLKFLTIQDQEYLSHKLMPVLPEARKCASKKAIDGVEELMRRSSSASNVSTPRSSSVEYGASRHDTSSAPSPVPAQPCSATTSEGASDGELKQNPAITFGAFPSLLPHSQGNLETAPQTVNGDEVDAQLRNMLQQTNIGARDTSRPILNAYRV